MRDAWQGGAGRDDWPGEDRLADVIEVLASTLTGHLAHEEQDGLPLIGVALTGAEWRGVGFKIARKNGLSRGGEMFAWMLDGAGREDAAATKGTLPPPLRLLYRAVWKPRFDKNPALVSGTRIAPPRQQQRCSIGAVRSGTDGTLGVSGARGGYGVSPGGVRAAARRCVVMCGPFGCRLGHP